MNDYYIRQLLKKYRQRDRELVEALSREEQKPIFLLQSDGVYLLQKYRWLILSNRSNITYHSAPRMDPHFRCLMNTYDYEDTLFRLVSKLRDFRNLKEKYIQFLSTISSVPKISIRFPARGTTLQNGQRFIFTVLSIHVPTRGTTGMTCIGIICSQNFNPRSREGNDACVSTSSSPP